MNEEMEQKLWRAARRAVPTIPENFSTRVIASVRRETESAPQTSMFESLAGLFPRMAAAVVVVIALCLAAEWYFERSADYAEVTQEWFFQEQ